ncbi:MAG: efflux RND transporter permease subunit [Bacteroidales bacterium]|nr:efflux RND transporter permease subunit [Bacteroidales bacterium]MCF8403622.1 efflux RND transporter permease subunit [Bacteroidales bacterium]
MENQIQKDEKVSREFKLTTFALNNKNTIFLLLFIILGFGYISYKSLPKELFPDIYIPTVMVQTFYFGNPPVDIENLISRPIEKELESIRGIKKITSNSLQDVSVIFVEFNTGIEINVALQEVRDAVDKAKRELPNDLLEDPQITDIDFSEFPIININLSGDYSVNELKYYAEFLEDEIEPISEISKVEITGLNDREVKINVDPYKLASYELSFTDIENAIASENVSMSGGDLRIGGSRRTLRVIGEFEHISEMKDIVIKHENQDVVYLRDVADVIYGFEDPDSYARLNKENVVTLQVVKKGGENLLNATYQIFEILENARESNLIPQNLNITITNDQSDMIKKQLSNLENSIIMGVLFVLLVLYFFLGIRNALFVGLAIPASMFLSFMILGLMGTTINMIVLFSLILALGMLVDNAIVVVENIYRFIDRGYSKYEAAKKAVGEIAMPIISSTATTLAAFFPLIFWDSMMGEFMKFLPITLIIVLTSSLFVALVIIPVVSSSYIRYGDQNPPPRIKRSLRVAGIMGGLAILFYIAKVYFLANMLAIFAVVGILNIFILYRISKWFQEKFLVWLENTYLRTLKFVMRKRNPQYFVFGTFLLLILTIVFYFARNPKVEFFPVADPDFINVIAELPIGTDIDVTDGIMKKMEDDIYHLLDDNQDLLKSLVTIVGKGAVGENEGFSGKSGGPNRGLITVSFIDYEYRGGRNTSGYLKMFADSLIHKYPGVDVTVDRQSNGPPTGKPINIEISGKDFDKLLGLSDSMIVFINNSHIEGIEGLKIDLDVGKPEMIVHIDRDKARMFGLSTYQIATTLRTALFGKEISDFKIGEDEYPIQLRLKEVYRNDISALLNQRITFRSASNGKIIQVPISAVADIEYSTTYGSVMRKDLSRVVTVWSNVIEGYNATTVNNEIRTLLNDFEMPEGYKYEFTGEQQEQAESAEFLVRALLIAISIMLIILVTQFNSIVKPGIILFSVVLSTIGVFGGLGTFKMDFVIIMTGIGIVSLAGVVVNNAIVLIDYINLLKMRKRKELGIEARGNLPLDESVDCIVEAGKTRLRPVLLTAITTILGLIPLASGLNIDFEGMLTRFEPNIYFGGTNAAFWGPMSWTIIFGLTFATFLTLIIVPSMYHALYKVKLWGIRIFTSKK